VHDPVDIHFVDYLGPVLAAGVFIAVMSLLKEPTRRNYNAVFAAGASGVYMSGGFGVWEVPFALVMVGTIAYLGLRSHRFIGVFWLMHSGWDLLHHLYGNAIWPFMPSSSFGCMVFDGAIAMWFLGGAPSIISRQSLPKAARRERNETSRAQPVEPRGIRAAGK
jgi:hypothetical protein